MHNTHKNNQFKVSNYILTQCFSLLIANQTIAGNDSRLAMVVTACLKLKAKIFDNLEIKEEGENGNG